jgi:hypothetical protein
MQVFAEVPSVEEVVSNQNRVLHSVQVASSEQRLQLVSKQTTHMSTARGPYIIKILNLFLVLYI